MIELLHLASKIVVFLCILTFALAVLVFKRLNFKMQTIATYFILACTIEVTAYAVIELGFETNLFLLHLSTLLEFLILSKIFQVLFAEVNFKIPFVTIVSFGSLLIVANTLFLQPLNVYNSYSFALVGMYGIVGILYYFAVTLEKSISSEEVQITKWLLISILLFHAVSMIAILFANLFINSEEYSLHWLWLIRASAILIIKLIILYQFFRFTKTIKFVRS